MIQSSISTFIPTDKETAITATQRLLLLCQSNELLTCGASEDLIRDKFLTIISAKDPQHIYTTKVISEAIKTKISSNLEAYLSETIRILSIEPAFHSPPPTTTTTTNMTPTPQADTEALYTHQDKGNRSRGTRGRGRGGRNRGGGRYERSYSPYGNRGSGRGRGRGQGRGGIGNGPRGDGQAGYQFGTADNPREATAEEAQKIQKAIDAKREATQTLRQMSNIQLPRNNNGHEADNYGNRNRGGRGYGRGPGRRFYVNNQRHYYQTFLSTTRSIIPT